MKIKIKSLALGMDYLRRNEPTYKQQKVRNTEIRRKMNRGGIVLDWIRKNDLKCNLHEGPKEYCNE